jgi:hypothetical protein
MTTKFEQLIEYVINDDQAKARELFHDIVVEKSREIYEELMDDEADTMEEGLGDSTGSASEDLIDQVETEEEGMTMEDDAEFDDEAEEDGEDLTQDMEKDHDEGGDMEDRVVDLEDKLDELMAEFEQLMGGEGASGEEMEPVDGEVGGDAYMDDDTSEFTDEPMPMSEALTMEKVPAPKHGDAGANAKSPVAFNSGATGMQGKPVKNTASESNPDGTSAPKGPSTKELTGFAPTQTAAKNAFKSAAKPSNSQASGVNSRTPFPKG